MCQHVPSLRGKHGGKIKDVRARGLLLALELEGSCDGETLSARLLDKGFAFGFKLNTFRFLPPLIIREHEVDRLICALDELLSE